jgi:hypothetical protein
MLESVHQDDFFDWCDDIGVQHKINYTIDNDLVSFIDRKIVVEFLKIHKQSELCGFTRSSYISKLKRYELDGWRIIFLYENEWVVDKDIVKSRIGSLLGINQIIYARKCEIINLSSKDGTTFFNTAHIQGAVSSPICYGLTYNDNTVAAMSFGKSRFNKNVEYELIRYANMLNTNVVGGASKLFKHFIKQYDPNSIISYSDKRWNTGNLYDQLGYKYSHIADPNYFYFVRINPLVLYSRQSFQKHKLKDKLELFDPLLTEWQNMVLNGYDRIWDCGNSVWIWNK